MKSFFNLFRILLKFGMPASLLLVPLLAIYGWLSPWAPAKDQLARYSGQTPLLVGAAYRARYMLDSHQVRSTRSYILVPGVLSEPRIITYTQDNAAPVTVTESRSALVFHLIWLVMCGIGTWWFWFRGALPQDPSKPKPLRGSAWFKR